MNEHIKLTEAQAQQIAGNYGRCSRIEPVATPDGNFIIPAACLSDANLQSINTELQALATDVQPIIALPEVGELCEGGRYYLYATEHSSIVYCVQSHNRTIYPPEQTPALFSFFRENSDDLEWIQNEFVKLGWKRMHNDKQYECIQAHMTLEGWTPDVTPALWLEVITTPDYPIWQQPTGAHDSYQIGDIVHYPTINDGLWISKINGNTTVPDGDVPYNRYWEPYND
jgi:hypothetical protein